MGQFLAFFYTLASAVWLYRCRRALKALKENPEVSRNSSPPSSLPLVSVLLPVKNEEANLEEWLKGLLSQTYSAKEIIVINDNSIDRTAEILARFVRENPTKIRALDAPPVPQGWTGKNWALAEGAPLAQGDWLLFTDADTRHEPWSLASSVVYAEGKRLDLLTLSPRCLTESFWEKLLQAAAMGFTGLWFPFAKVNDPHSSLVFGNGQFLMIRKKAYERLGGHARVKEAYLEDFALVREAKKMGLKTECAIGTQIFGTRMYRSFSAIWLGWRRIFLHAFEKNFGFLFSKTLSVFTFSFLPFFFFPFLNLPDPDTSWHVIASYGGIFVVGLMLVTAWKTHSVLGAPRVFALLHPIAGLILTGILTDTTWQAFQKKEVGWR